MSSSDSSDYETGRQKKSQLDPQREDCFETILTLSSSPSFKTVELVDDARAFEWTQPVLPPDTSFLEWRLKRRIQPASAKSILQAPLAALSNVHLYCTEEEEEEQDDDLETILAHILNRVLTARDRIIANTQASKLLSTTEEGEEETPRDQGFTRPRALIILPFRRDALKVVHTLSRLLPACQVEQRARFDAEYSLSEEAEREQRESHSRRSTDFQRTFRGNTDDCFRVGVKLTRKAIKLYADLSASDIIVCSALGLKLAIQQAENGPNKSKGENYDFLSGIECVFLDHCDIIDKQNWEHVDFCWERLDRLPTAVASVGVDLQRVLTLHLEQQARKCLQTITRSRYPFLDLQATICRARANVLGNCTQTVRHRGIAHDLQARGVKLQLHTAYQGPRLEEEPAARLEYFRQTFVDKLHRLAHVCVVVPHYYDYLQVCKLLRSEDIAYVGLDEYDDAKATTKKRSQFFNGHATVLVTTERFHFFRRVRVRGIRKLIFFQLPERIDFCIDWVDMLTEDDHQKKGGSGGKKTRTYELPVIVSPAIDSLRLERFLGSDFSS